jgi:nicotinate phosphoribosyltransferase
MYTPVITSLLDLDFYKLTMAQVAWRHFPNVRVRYAFKNRTKDVPLAEIISEEELRRELDHVRSLKLRDDELEYLRESKYIPKGLFKDDFRQQLKSLHLPPVEIRKEGKTYAIEVEGLWHEAIWWETMILAIVNELYYRALMRAQKCDWPSVRSAGQENLLRKIDILTHHYPDVRFSDFGTRRRFSGEWQEEVLRKLVAYAPNHILGTSNVHLAYYLDMKPIGTFAHEMYMVFSGIFHKDDDDVRASHNRVLQYWWQEYSEPLSIALTDTYGTDFFFSDFTSEQALLWRGLRHDSGDPIVFGRKAIAFYEKLGIDPRTKTLVFSDGLDLSTLLGIWWEFKDRIQVVFGWGTNLTNDLGFKPLSLVVKATEACGHGTVKLSDNLAKAMGNLEDVERFKKIFGHTVDTSTECTY